jgi:hypothetical protein
MAVAKSTPPKGSFCDGRCKTYPSEEFILRWLSQNHPSEGFILRWPSQNLPLQKVHFATAIAKPPLQRVHFATAIAKPPLRRVHFAMAIAKPTPPTQLLPHMQRKLTCIDSVPISGSFAASHQIVGITHRANWRATNPTLFIAVVNLTTPTELESVCQSARTVYW